MIVFRVKKDRELLCLLTSDELLKKYVMRAENHHMIILADNFPKVRRRLDSFGFFVGLHNNQ